MTTKDLLDELQSLGDSIQERCRNVTRLGVECHGYDSITLDNIGYLEPQLEYQYNPYVLDHNQNQPYYPTTFETYPHSSYPVYEPYTSQNLIETPLDSLSSNATFLPSSDPFEQILREHEDILRRLSIESENFSKKLEHVQLSQEEEKNQVRPYTLLQEVENDTHTSSSFDTDLHFHEFGYNTFSSTPIQSSKSSLPPTPNLSTSKTTEEFFLEELPEPIQPEAPGQSDEYDEVDEEIEMEEPNWRFYPEDSASHGVEEPNTEVVLNDVATSLETLMDIVPPPLPKHNIFIDKPALESKEGFALKVRYKPSLHYIMTYTSWSDEDLFDQPTSLEEVEEVDSFVIPQVKQNIHFEPLSPLVGHTIFYVCFNLFGMFQHYHLYLLMDAREPPVFLEK